MWSDPQETTDLVTFTEGILSVNPCAMATSIRIDF